MGRLGGKSKLTIEEMRRIADNRGGNCLSTDYVRGKDKLNWRCEAGHCWAASADSIKQGSWCPFCATERGRQARMLGIGACRESARERGGECLSTRYDGTKKPLLWSCQQGHQWTAQANSVRNGHWCLICANEKKSRDNTNLSIESMRELANDKGGLCHSVRYRNVYSELEWECVLGHRWRTAPSNIIAGRWCPSCGRGLSERICRAIFAHLFSAQFPSVRPAWLLGESDRPLELDGYCEQYRIAFEYQGAQHSIPVKHYNQDGKTLPDLQARDAWKRRVCRDKGIVLIEIPYTVAHDLLETYIRAQLDLAGQSDGLAWRPRLDITGISLLADDRLAGYQNLAQQHGGACLSRVYLGQKTKLRWRCANRHEWLGNPAQVRKGSWCPTCRVEQAAARHRIETLAKIIAYVTERGGQLLSKQFKGHNAPLACFAHRSTGGQRLGPACAMGQRARSAGGARERWAVGSVQA